jgi:3-phenylpropionate/cinnamic acid dioxygenase small subunit
MDRVAIDRLLVRYCKLVDAGDWDGVGALFAHGALLAPDGSELAKGAEGVAAFFRDSVLLHDGSPRTKHLVLHTVVEDLQDGSAEVRSSYLVLQALDRELRPIITGRYVDRVADGAFIERRYFVDLAGDLSQHLRRG